MKMKCICVTYIMIWERLSQSKPYNKTSCKQPPFKSYRKNFLASWFYSSSLFFKTLVSDHLTHGVVSLFAVCKAPLRVHEKLSVTT